MQLSKYLQAQLRSDFLRNVITLFTGSSIAQLIPIVISPILTRLYLPEEFGSLGLLVSIAGYFSIIATLQYSSAIMLPKRDQDAINVAALAVLITISITSVSLILVTVFKNGFISLLNAEEISGLIFYLPIFVFLSGLFETLDVWSSRKKRFKSLAKRQVTQTVVQAGTKLIFGIRKLTSTGLVVGTIGGQFVATAVLFIQTVSLDRNLYKSIRFSSIKEQAKVYINFPKYTTWQGFFDIFNVSGMVLLINAYHGSAILGIYAFTLGIMQKPIHLIGKSISQVYYQKATEMHQKGSSLWRNTKKLMLRLFLLGLPFVGLVLLFGPWLFGFVFGQKWSEAGVFAQIITPWVFAKFITYPLGNVPQIFNRQKQYFLFSLVVNFVPLTVFLILSYMEVDLYVKLLFYYILMLFCIIGLYFWIRKLILNSQHNTQPTN